MIKTFDEAVSALTELKLKLQKYNLLTHDEKHVFNESLNILANGEKDKRNVFKKPVIAEITEYFREKTLEKQWPETDIINEAEKFHDHYENTGWKVGKNKMKNWKLAVNNWIKNAENFKTVRKGITDLTNTKENENNKQGQGDKHYTPGEAVKLRNT